MLVWGWLLSLDYLLLLSVNLVCLWCLCKLWRCLMYFFECNLFFLNALKCFFVAFAYAGAMVVCIKFVWFFVYVVLYVFCYVLVFVNNLIVWLMFWRYLFVMCVVVRGFDSVRDSYSFFAMSRIAFVGIFNWFVSVSVWCYESLVWYLFNVLVRLLVVRWVIVVFLECMFDDKCLACRNSSARRAFARFNRFVFVSV